MNAETPNAPGRDVAIADQAPRAEYLPPSRREAHQVIDAIPELDTARFEAMQRIASVMADSPLVPIHLRAFKEGRGDDAKWTLLPARAAIANCFLVVDQAVRWHMPPFAVAQCTFVTPDGKIGYEGKLVAAALKRIVDVRLQFEFTGEPNTIGRGIRIWGVDNAGEVLKDAEGKALEFEGTVEKLASRKKGGGITDLWIKQPDDQLIYRGSRQWVRRHRPEVILGVISDDEIEEAREAARVERQTRPAIAGNAQPPRLAKRQEAAEAAPPAATTEPAKPAEELPTGPVETGAAAAALKDAVDAGQAKKVDEKPPASQATPAADAGPMPDCLKRTGPSTPIAEAGAGPFTSDQVEQVNEAAELVAAFVKNAATVTSLEELEEAGETVPNDLPRALAIQVENAWDDATKRLEAAAKKAAAGDDFPGDKPSARAPDIDPGHPAYGRGARDYAAGVTKMLNPGIKNDPVAMAHWVAGQKAGAAAAAGRSK